MVSRLISLGLSRQGRMFADFRPVALRIETGLKLGMLEAVATWELLADVRRR